MKAPDFDYLRPANLADAIALLADHDGDAMPLAGGQSLMPMMNFRVTAPAALIDLVDVAELRGIALDGATLRIGAMTRYVDLMKDDTVKAAAPLIGMALPHVAHDAIRNRGTLGGSLALADPAAEMPAVMLALDASFELVGPGGVRMVKADDFFSGYYETVLAEDELLTSIHIPAATSDQSFGFHELTQRHGDYALAGVAVARAKSAFRCAFFGVADRALLVPALEAALSDGADIVDALKHLSAIDFSDDTKANAATRQRLSGVALTRALEGMPS
jgi:carbon-monoxide dehydrogenase medium subunit